jgi:hypothetical protein
MHNCRSRRNLAFAWLDRVKKGLTSCLRALASNARGYTLLAERWFAGPF